MSTGVPLSRPGHLGLRPAGAVGATPPGERVEEELRWPRPKWRPATAACIEWYEIPACDLRRRHPAVGTLSPRLRQLGTEEDALATSFRLRLIVSLSVLAVLLARVDVRGVGAALQAVEPFCFFAAVVVDFVSRAIMIGRWVLLLRVAGQPVPGWSAAKIFFASTFVGAAMPTGGADVTRAYVLSRRTGRAAEASASVVVDRLIGVTALVVLGAVTLAVGDTDPHLPQDLFLAGFCGVAVIAISSVMWADHVARALARKVSGSANGARWLLNAAAAMTLYRTRGEMLLAVFGLSLLVQFMRIVEVALLGDSLGLGVGFDYYLAYIPVGLLMLMLPVSFLGIGVPQGVLIWLMRPTGVSDAQSFALSTLVVVLAVIGTLPGIYFYLRAR